MLDFRSRIARTAALHRLAARGMKKLLDEARAKNVLVVYTTSGMANADAILQGLAPTSGEPLVRAASVDKFTNTDLKRFSRTKAFKR